MVFRVATTRVGDINSGQEPVMKTTGPHTASGTAVPCGRSPPRSGSAVCSASAITGGSPPGSTRLSSSSTAQSAVKLPRNQELRIQTGPIVMCEHKPASTEGTFDINDQQPRLVGTDSHL